MENQQPEENIGMLNEVFSFKELLDIILNFYCFKNNHEQIHDEENMDDEEGENWKKYMKTEQNENSSNEDIIPKDINSMIENAFKAQLKKFT